MERDSRGWNRWTLPTHREQRGDRPTAERTGAIAMMQYPEVQQLAKLYTLQSPFTDTLKPAFMAANHVGTILSATPDPHSMPPPARDAMRARVLERR
jgi:hypothetical protein